MEKDKSRFIIWLLVIIIILLVAVVGVLLVKTVNENGTKVMGDANKQENVNNEVVDNVENTVENNNTTNTTEQENNVTESVKELTEEKVLELAKRVLENGRGTPDEVVKVLYGQYIATTDEEFTENYGLYKMTNVNYNDFKSEALKYFSEEYFNKENVVKGHNITIEKNGKVAILQSGWSGVGHEVRKAAFYKMENDVYYYKIETVNGRTKLFETYNMTIKLINDNFVIDSLGV